MEPKGNVYRVFHGICFNFFNFCVIFYKKTVMNCKFSYQISLLISIANKYLLLEQILRSQCWLFSYKMIKWNFCDFLLWFKWHPPERVIAAFESVGHNRERVASVHWPMFECSTIQEAPSLKASSILTYTKVEVFH